MIATATKESRLHERFPEVVQLMVAGGFVMTLAELFLMGHAEKSQAIALAMCLLGAVGSALALMLGGRLKKLCLGLLIVVAASGLFGVYEHLEEAAEHREKAARQEQAQLAAGQPVKKTKKHDPPPMAPLSLSGLALLGGMSLMASKR